VILPLGPMAFGVQMDRDIRIPTSMGAGQHCNLLSSRKKIGR